MDRPRNRRNTSGSLVGRVVLAGGALATALGLAVLVGWYTHLPVLIQVSPGFFPMPANAALGFLLCGAALVGLHLRRQGVVIASGLGTVALGLATLAEYTFDWSSGLDQLLLQPYITFGTSPPGRMAPNAALCFVLTGAALLLAGAGPRLRHSSSGLGLLGAVVWALGMTALASYVAGLSTYAWWPLTRMAAHGSVGFVVLGLAVMGLGWQRGERGCCGFPRWLPLSVGIFAVTVTLCLWQTLEAMPGASRNRAGALAAQLAPSAGRVKVTAELLKDELHALPRVALGTGLVMSVLLALAVYSAQAARRPAQAEEASRRHPEREVAQRQRAEEALRQTQDRLEQPVRERTAELEQANRELLGESSQRQRVPEEPDRSYTLSRDLLCICDFEGRLQSVNPAWERTLGFRETELMAQPALNLVHPDDREATLREIQKLASGAEAKGFQNRYRARDGSYRWFLWYAMSLLEGRQIYAAARDITELKQAEEGLREREERFRRIFEDASIGISIVGPTIGRQE